MTTTPIVTSRAHQVPQVPQAAQEPEESQDLGGDRASRAHLACRDPQGNEVGISGCSTSIKGGVCKYGACGMIKAQGRLNLGKDFSLVWMVPEELCP